MEQDVGVESVTVERIQSTGLSLAQAIDIHGQLQKVLANCGSSAVWSSISQKILKPEHPYVLHQLMYYSTYRGWDTSVLGPPPAWIPTPETARLTNLGRLLETRGYELLGSAYKTPMESFPALQRLSAERPEIYYPLVFKEQSLVFHEPPRCILDKSNEAFPGGQWLPGAVLNVAESCLASKATKTDSSIAVMWRNEGEDDLPVKILTLADLRAIVSRVASALDAVGFQKGDTIAIDMPMNVHAVIAYLAIIWGGFVVVSIADSFVAPEIATRVRVSKAKGIFTQDHILRGARKLSLYSRVLEAHAPLAIVVPADGKSIGVPLREGISLGMIFWPMAIIKAGEPKAIPWTHATPLRCAADAWAHQDARYGDVLAWPTNLGWMMGPFIIYASFLNGAALALYNGAPHGRGFGKFIQDAGVTMLGTVPSLVKTWKSTDCMASLDWSRIRCFCSTGEASSIDDDLWLSGRAGYKPVLECCGGTELGAAYVGGCLLQSQSLAAFSTPGMGSQFVILDETDNPYADNQQCTGEVALIPFSLGASSTLLNADHDAIYFKGMPIFKGRQLRRHGDLFQRLAGGFYRALGRADDTMNLGGIKTSAVEIEWVCNKAHQRVLETAAIGLQPPGGGPEDLVIAAVLKEGPPVGIEELQKTFSTAVSSQLNPLFKIKAVAVLPEFPRTASNKLMRRVLRTQFRENLKVPLSSKL